MTININLPKVVIDKMYNELKSAGYSDGQFGVPLDCTRLIIYDPKLKKDNKFIDILKKYVEVMLDNEKL